MFVSFVLLNTLTHRSSTDVSLDNRAAIISSSITRQTRHFAIAKCIFHSNSLIRFVARQGIMFSRYKSLLGSNFHFCVSRFKFSESAFLDNKIYVTHMVKNTALICGMTIVYL